MQRHVQEVCNRWVCLAEQVMHARLAGRSRDWIHNITDEMTSRRAINHVDRINRMAFNRRSFRATQTRHGLRRILVRTFLMSAWMKFFPSHSGEIQTDPNQRFFKPNCFKFQNTVLGLLCHAKNECSSWLSSRLQSHEFPRI